MPRDVDERKTRRVLTKLRRAREAAKARGEDLSDWEIEFVQSVEGRLEEYGSAFNDPEKGDLSEPLSGRQRVKLNEVSKKAKGQAKRGKAKADAAGQAPDRGGFKQRKPLRARKPMGRGKGAKAWTPRVRDIAEDMAEDAADASPPDAGPDAGADEAPPRPVGPPALRVVKGGKEDEA